MSSIRIFVLDAFRRHGEMHGHQLNAYAEKERVALWTDISPSGIYQVVKRLCAEELLQPVRAERVGNFPERQIYAITDGGMKALAHLREQGLSDVVLRPDPFDLALTRTADLDGAALRALIEARLVNLRSALETRTMLEQRAGPYLTPVETVALSHRAHVLRADIAWHQTLIAHLPDLDLNAEANLQAWDD